MFSKLTDFSYKRTPIQAFGFYLAYFLMALILGAVAGAVVSTFFASSNTVEAGFEAGKRGGQIIAIAFPTIMSFLVLKSKKLLGNFGLLLLALLSGLLGVFGGALLGLIPAAFLTTRSK